MSRLALCFLVVAVLAAAALDVRALAAQPRAAAPVRTAPPERACQHDPTAAGAAGPGDLDIADDGTWFECVCETRVFVEPDCMWYEITSPAPDPQRLRRNGVIHPSPALRRLLRHARLTPAIGARP